MMGDTYELACEIQRETEQAILLLDVATGEEVWIPLSQVRSIHRLPDGKTATVVMERWIAAKKGLL